MALTLERKQEIVNQFHFDTRNLEWEKENGAPENAMNVNLQLLDPKELEGGIAEEDTGIAVILQYMLPMDAFVISGLLSQVNIVKNQKISEQDELTQEDMEQLAAPLFDLLKRLVYENTEIALDQPGIQLEF
ncbi:DUF1149 family protein [Lactococcus termiticola]|uniref:Transposase n=1 Tax=Lactococcus termiticola TaxID=2169526 RepID=A0A2R5HHD7_9LACT|nr:DUF1149 family protein [Lactococcus termiticola]GBG97392.1 transposase [Lactococcus termiticola]